MTTLAILKSDVETHLSISISDADLRWAYNEFASLVKRLMQRRYDKERQVLTTSVGTGGLDLTTTIPNARNYEVGFEVWRGTDFEDLRTEDFLERIHPGIAMKAGYYIINNRLYLKNVDGSIGKPTNNISVIIMYRTKRTPIDGDTDLETYEFEFDQDLEPAFVRYLQAIFFDGNFRPANVASALAQAREWISIFASESQTT